MLKPLRTETIALYQCEHCSIGFVFDRLLGQNIRWVHVWPKTASVAYTGEYCEANVTKVVLQ